MPIEEIRANIKVIIGGGLNEPRDAILTLTLGLLADPDQKESVLAKPELWPTAFEEAVRRLGWRVYGTNQPRESLSLEHAVLAYRNEYQVERSLGRLKGRPLSLTPMYVQRDDHATGLIRLLSIPKSTQPSNH